MRKILIPIDFSENSMNAIKYAMNLFKYDLSEFLIMNAYADKVYENTLEMSRPFFEQYQEKVKEATDRALQKVVVEMMETSSNPKHNYEYVSVFGSLVDAANDIADKEDVDIIVMGTKGETNDRDITFGSQTLQVVKYVKCPVLMVPQGFRNNPPKNILFATDYLIPYKRRELKLVSVIAKSFGARLNFLHMTQSKNSTHRQLDNKMFLEGCTKENIVSFITIEGDSIEQEVNAFIVANDINFLVMVNSRHSYMENLLETSAIETLGLQTNIPFLVLQNLPR